MERFSTQFFTMSHLVRGVISGFTTKHDLQQISEFFSDERMSSLGSFKRGLKQTLEEIKSNIEWLDENEIAIQDWFRVKLEES